MTIVNLGAPQPPEGITMPAGTGLSNITSNAMKYGSMGAQTGNAWAAAGGAAFGIVKGILDTKNEQKKFLLKDYLAQRTYGRQVEQLNTDGAAQANAATAGTGYFSNMYSQKNGGTIGCKSCGGKMAKGREFMQNESLPMDVIDLVFKLSIDISKLKDKSKKESEVGEVEKSEEAKKCAKIEALKEEVKATKFKVRYFDGGIIPEQFRDGGQMNVIPGGVLHAHKNNIGDKGIPIVMKMEGSKLKKVAEIEKEEIIFTLGVTKFLEKYAEKLDSGEITEDELIEVGKCIKEEITNNTVDKSSKLLGNE